jgi:pimeloyl-ACP methyl ester carboxylesterase
MGQGSSVKPALFIDFKDNQDVLAGLLDELKIEKAYIAGISFGGVVVLRFGIEYPDRTKALIPMSTFSEMDAKLEFIGQNLYEGMVNVGFEYLVKLFVTYNFSAEWIKNNEKRIPVAVRESFNNNDLYGIQNMMESLSRFTGFTDELKKVNCPTLIMHGEYDSLTDRNAHEILRREIPNSRLIIMQNVCHAFTLEIPNIVCRIIKDFINQVETNNWQSKQDVVIATDDPNSGKLHFPCRGDHTRAIPFCNKNNPKLNNEEKN